MQAVDPTLFFLPEIGLSMLRNSDCRWVRGWPGLMNPLAMVVTGQCGRAIVPAERIKCPGISRRMSLPHQLLNGITQLADTLALLLPPGFKLCAVNGLLVAWLKAPFLRCYETIHPISRSKVDSAKKTSGPTDWPQDTKLPPEKSIRKPESPA